MKTYSMINNFAQAFDGLIGFKAMSLNTSSTRMVNSKLLTITGTELVDKAIYHTDTHIIFEARLKSPGNAKITKSDKSVNISIDGSERINSIIIPDFADTANSVMKYKNGTIRLEMPKKFVLLHCLT